MQFIAEPGRYFAEASMHLATHVHGYRERVERADALDLALAEKLQVCVCVRVSVCRVCVMMSVYSIAAMARGISCAWCSSHFRSLSESYRHAVAAAV